MSFIDNALSLITLASLFILGPAIGYAVISGFRWQSWSVPVQHLAVGVCTMFAVAGMILGYGFLWERSPSYVAWYSWVQQVPLLGRASAPVEVRQPLKK